MLDSIERLIHDGRVSLTYYSTPITLTFEPKGDATIEIWYDEPNTSKYTVERSALFVEIIRSSEELLEYVALVDPDLSEVDSVRDLEQSLSEAKQAYYSSTDEKKDQ